MIKENTPIEYYKIRGREIAVKREDLCTQPPGPPFSKCRGLYAHLIKLRKQNINIVGYAESAISMAGWGVAWCCERLGMKAVIFDPQYINNTPANLIYHRKQWNKFGAEIVPIPAGRTSVNYNIAKKMLKKEYENYAVMLPTGLRLPETIQETAKEWKRTMRKFQPNVVVVCVGSGTICAGILKENTKVKMFGILAYSSSIDKKLGDIYEKAEVMQGGLLGNNLLTIINDDWEYAESSIISCPFPCHPYYDLKAWEWLVENLSDVKGRILFWNIGSEV